MQPGTRIAQKYRVLRALGEGAMGSVWAAENELTEREFAIKLIHRSHVMADELRERILREARACGRLRHKNVVEVYDVGETDEGDPFLVMELLEGETLESLLARRQRLPSLQVAAIGFQVASALAAAHAAGIIHRDLKPANIFLHQDADLGTVVKVVDFGVSKLVADRNATTTTTGAAVGSPAYMSPEQATAQSDIDHRADLWSVGVVLFEAAAGKPAFDGETAFAVVGNILHGPLPDLAAVAEGADPRLSAVISRCLVRDPRERIPSARQLAAELEELLPRSALAVLRDLDEEPTLTAESGRRMLGSADPVAGPPPVAREHADAALAQRTERRNWLPLAAGVGLGAIVFGAMVAGILLGRSSEPSDAGLSPPRGVEPASAGTVVEAEPTVVPAPVGATSTETAPEASASATTIKPKRPVVHKPRAPLCPTDKVYFGADGKARCALAGHRLR